MDIKYVFTGMQGAVGAFIFLWIVFSGIGYFVPLLNFKINYYLLSSLFAGFVIFCASWLILIFKGNEFDVSRG